MMAIARLVRGAILEIPVSDRGMLEDLSQSRLSGSTRSRKLLILNGEMSEWLKEHAWKLIPLARADAHQNPPTHSRSTTSRNIDMRRRVPVNHGVCPGFQGACDTVLTQNSVTVSAIRTDVRRYAWRCDQLRGCIPCQVPLLSWAATVVPAEALRPRGIDGDRCANTQGARLEKRFWRRSQSDTETPRSA